MAACISCDTGRGGAAPERGGVLPRGTH